MEGITMMDNTHLTLEQQFNLTLFEHEVGKMSHEQAQEILVKLYENMLVRENTYKNLIRQGWNSNRNV